MNTQQLKRFLECSNGKQVKVIEEGKDCVLPKPEIMIDRLSEISDGIQRIETVTSHAIEKIDEKANRSIEAMQASLETVAQKLDVVARSVVDVVETMSSPIKPIYNREGKLIGSHRVKTLGDLNAS